MEQKIEIPKGYEIDSFDRETGILKFKKINPMEKFKHFNEVLEFNNIDKHCFQVYSSLFDARERAWLILSLLSKALNSVTDKKHGVWFYVDYCGRDVYLSRCQGDLKGSTERITYNTGEACDFALKHYASMYRNLNKCKEVK